MEKVNHLLGTEKDVRQYWELIAKADEDGKLPPNKLGVQGTFKFASQPFNVHPCNSLPPDLTHDLCEGCISKLTSFILKHLAREFDYSKSKVVRIINSYQFYDTKFSIATVTGGLKVIGDAVQVCIN